MGRIDEFGDLNFDQPEFEAPPPPAPKKAANPWTDDELAQSQQWANDYYTSHKIPAGYGTADDLGNTYLSQRRSGVGHQAAMDATPGLLGWDKYTAPGSGAGTGDGGFPDDSSILAQIAKWAAMPGADPSLGADPNYWLGAIKSRGGLNAGNLQYWQDASVGPNAFFNNPNREKGNGGGGGDVTHTSTPPVDRPSDGTTSFSGGTNDQLSSFLMNWLTGQSTASNNARSSLLSRLLGQADEYAKPVTADDPNIKASTDAYHGTLARSVNQYRTRMAERAHAEGVGTGAFDSSVGNAEMGAGRSEANFTTGLMNTEMQSRRAALLDTLRQGAGLLSAQDQADIQAKVAAIDAMMKGRGLDLTDKGLDQGFSLGEGNLSLGARGQDITKLLGLGSLDLQKLGIGNQRDEFYDQLGSSNAFSQAQLDYLYKALGLSK